MKLPLKILTEGVWSFQVGEPVEVPGGWSAWRGWKPCVASPNALVTHLSHLPAPDLYPFVVNPNIE